MKLFLALSFAIATTFADPTVIIRDDNKAAKGTAVTDSSVTVAIDSEDTSNVSANLRGAQLFPFVQDDNEAGACKKEGAKCYWWVLSNCCGELVCTLWGSAKKFRCNKP